MYLENLIGNMARMSSIYVAKNNSKPPRIDTRSESIQINEAKDNKKEYGTNSRRSVRQLENSLK